MPGPVTGCTLSQFWDSSVSALDKGLSYAQTKLLAFLENIYTQPCWEETLFVLI